MKALDETIRNVWKLSRKGSRSFRDEVRKLHAFLRRYRARWHE